MSLRALARLGHSPGASVQGPGEELSEGASLEGAGRALGIVWDCKRNGPQGVASCMGLTPPHKVGIKANRTEKAHTAMYVV